MGMLRLCFSRFSLLILVLILFGGCGRQTRDTLQANRNFQQPNPFPFPQSQLREPEANENETEPVVMDPQTPLIRFVPQFAETPASVDGGTPHCEGFTGTTNVFYFNNTTHSTMPDIDLPHSCPNPILLTDSVKDTIPCGNGLTTTACNNEPGMIWATLQSYPIDKGDAVSVFTSAQSLVHVGKSSPAFPVDWTAICNPQKARLCSVSLADGDGNSSPVGFAGYVHVTIGKGQPASSLERVNYPPYCPNPSVELQSRSGSFLCGNASGPIVCPGRGTTSQDAFVRAVNANSEGFSVQLFGQYGGIWPTGSGSYRVDFLIRCNG